MIILFIYFINIYFILSFLLLQIISIQCIKSIILSSENYLLKIIGRINSVNEIQMFLASINTSLSFNVSPIVINNFTTVC